MKLDKSRYTRKRIDLMIRVCWQGLMHFTTHAPQGRTRFFFFSGRGPPPKKRLEKRQRLRCTVAPFNHNLQDNDTYQWWLASTHPRARGEPGRPTVETCVNPFWSVTLLHRVRLPNWKGLLIFKAYAVRTESLGAVNFQTIKL